DVGRCVPSIDLAVIHAAGKSGGIAESMRLLADYYQQRAQFARSFMGQVAYPFFLVHLALVIFPIQLLTRLVLEGQVLQFLQQKMMIFVPLYAVAFLLIFASQGRHGEAWRSLIERFIRPVPALGPAKRGMALARLAVALEALISAGVSIIDG